MADPIDYNALFSDDPSVYGPQAEAMANAMRRRRAAGTLATVLGGPFAAAGKDLSTEAMGQERMLEGAAQHRAQMDVQRQHYAALRDHQRVMEDQGQGRLDLGQQRIDAVAKALELRGLRVVVDQFGNPQIVDTRNKTVTRPTRGGGAPASQPVPGSAPQPAAATAPAVGPAASPGAAPAPAQTAAPIIAPPPGSNMTQAAFDQAAEQLFRTGSGGKWGKAQAIMEKALRDRVAQLHPDTDLASTHGAYKADQKSLDSQTRLLDLTKSWEATGKANLGVLRGISQELVNGGSPLSNRPLRWLYQNALGDPTVAKFKAAHAAVVNEYAKILSGNTGSGGVTEGARHEAEGMLPLDATPAQIAAAADVLETDAGNRLSALTKQVGETKGRMGGKAESGGGKHADLRAKYGL
jgi:hypothetical protein